MTQQMGGRKLEKRLTNKKKEKAQKLNSFVTRYLALCSETGHMMYAVLKPVDPEQTTYQISYKVKEYKQDNVNVPDSVRLQDELIELEQTEKIVKDSPEHKEKVAAIDAARAKELQDVMDALPMGNVEDEEREIKYETALKLQQLILLSKDKNEAHDVIMKFIKSLNGEVVPEEKKEETTAEAKPETEQATA